MDVSFELTTNDTCPADDAIFNVLVRWAKGKMLINLLPNVNALEHKVYINVIYYEVEPVLELQFCTDYTY